MKKLIKFLMFVGVLGGVAWALRDQLMPPPQTPSSSPPAFRTPAPTTPDSAAPDDGQDLQRVHGIGPVRVGQLAEHGITTFAGLAGADAADLADKLGVAASQTEDWISQAGNLT